MRTVFGKLLLATLLSAGLMLSSAQAESSKLSKVDLDVATTSLVRAEIGQLGWYYWMDSTACICWVGGKNASDNYASASVFDCKKLKAHPKMADHMGCLDETAATPAAAAEKK